MDQLQAGMAAGRFCYAFYIDEDYAELVSDAIVSKAVHTRGGQNVAMAVHARDPTIASDRVPEFPHSELGRRSSTSSLPVHGLSTSNPRMSRLPLPRKRS